MRHTLTKLTVILTVITALLIPVISGTSVSAETVTGAPLQPGQTAPRENVVLPKSFLIGDQNGIHVDVNGIYYIDERGLGPGDTFSKTLTIQNLEQDDRAPEAQVPYKLAMMVEPLSSDGSVDLMDAVHLTLSLDGNVLYDGRIRGDEGFDMVRGTLDLGEYKMGEQRVLEIRCKVDENMPLTSVKSEADFAWHFYAWREVVDAPPKTGWEYLQDNWPYVAIGGAALFIVILILARKHKDRKMEEAA